MTWRLPHLGLLALILAGCAGPKSYFHAGGATSLPAMDLSSPDRTIVVLYTAGADSNDSPAPCREGGGVPPVLLALAGVVLNGKTVVIHGYCPASVGNMAAGQSMSEARAPELEQVIRGYLAQGIAERNIFVAGHSMGGWAAILVAARRQVEIGGVIAFAPANGVWTRDRRGPYQWAAYARQRTATESLPRLEALIYMFERDPFNGPEDLAFLQAVPGVDYVAAPACAPGSPHNTASRGCFRDAEQERIRRFIADRTL